jgi:hypothetical protein
MRKLFHEAQLNLGIPLPELRVYEKYFFKKKCNNNRWLYETITKKE